MNREIVEALKEYILKNSIDTNSLDLSFDKTITDIKSNPILLADLFIKNYNELLRIFKDCDIDYIKKFLDSNRAYFISISALSSYKIKTYEFGKSRAKANLYSYIVKNNSYICELVDFYKEVTE